MRQLSSLALLLTLAAFALLPTPARAQATESWRAARIDPAETLRAE